MSDTGPGTNAQVLAILTQYATSLNGIGNVMSRLAQMVPPPATATSPGIAGAWAVDSGFFYLCIATNSWKRVAIAVW